MVIDPYSLFSIPTSHASLKIVQISFSAFCPRQGIYLLITLCNLCFSGGIYGSLYRLASQLFLIYPVTVIYYINPSAPHIYISKAKSYLKWSGGESFLKTSPIYIIYVLLCRTLPYHIFPIFINPIWKIWPPDPLQKKQWTKATILILMVFLHSLIW